MDTPEVIAQKSLEFLETLIDIDELVAPLSALPYPKETMEKEILDHAASLAKSTGNESGFGLRLRLAYAALAGCIDDVDVKLIERVEDILEKTNIQLDDKKHMDEETKRAFLDHGGTESEVARYIGILSDMERERQNLVSALDIELGKASVGVRD